MRHRSVWISVVQLAGLIGTGAAIWFGSISPRLRHHSVAEIVTDAFLYALLAFGWAVSLTVLLSFALGRPARTQALSLVLPTARTAVWFAPAAILLAQRSPAALIPAIAIVIGTTQILYTDWIVVDPERRSPIPFAISLATAFALEGGGAAALLGRPILPPMLFSAGAALLTFLMLAGGVVHARPSRSLPQSAFGVVLTIILAAGLTSVHMYYRSHGHSGPTTDTDEPVRNGEVGPNDIKVIGDVFPGVILRPPVKPYTVLVAPRPSWIAGSLSAFTTHPYSIPFTGEYWLYRPPQTRPPYGAVLRTGDPVELGFRTTDHAVLTMKARQRLDHPVDLRCCRALRLAISNEDQFPGTVALEVVVSDTRGHRPKPFSLGSEKVTVWPRAKSESTVYETLEFKVPGGLREADQIEVIMHRDLVRADRSARISIERFVLVPAEGI